jgi:hypothetical protein
MLDSEGRFHALIMRALLDVATYLQTSVMQIDSSVRPAGGTGTAHDGIGDRAGRAGTARRREQDDSGTSDEADGVHRCTLVRSKHDTRGGAVEGTVRGLSASRASG